MQASLSISTLSISQATTITAASPFDTTQDRPISQPSTISVDSPDVISGKLITRSAECLLKHTQKYIQDIPLMCTDRKMGGICAAMSFKFISDSMKHGIRTSLFNTKESLSITNAHQKYVKSKVEHDFTRLNILASRFELSLTWKKSQTRSLEGGPVGPIKFHDLEDGWYYISLSDGMLIKPTSHGIALLKEGSTYFLYDQNQGILKGTENQIKDNIHEFVGIIEKDGISLRSHTILKVDRLIKKPSISCVLV